MKGGPDLSEIRKFVCDFCREESADPRTWLVLVSVLVQRLKTGKEVLRRRRVEFCGPGCLDHWLHREVGEGVSRTRDGAPEATHTGTLSEAQLLAACGNVTAAAHEN